MLLAIESTAGAGSLALYQEKQCVATLDEPDGHRLAERLSIMVEQLLGEASISYRDVKSIVASRGPGSFTGVRIGLALARGLAMAIDCPVRGVNTLDALYAAACQTANVSGECLILVDARRGEWYAQRFASNGRAEATPVLINHAQLAALSLPEALITNNAGLLAEVTEETAFSRLPVTEIHPHAKWLGLSAVATSTLPEGREPDTEEDSARPLYVRPPDAALPSRPML